MPKSATVLPISVCVLGRLKISPGVNLFLRDFKLFWGLIGCKGEKSGVEIIRFFSNAEILDNSTGILRLIFLKIRV